YRRLLGRAAGARSDPLSVSERAGAARRRAAAGLMHPFDSHRVVTTAVNVPGPFAAARLRGLGAHVTKVEPPGGDPLAISAPDWYRELAGEDVVSLDLKSADGR